MNSDGKQFERQTLNKRINNMESTRLSANNQMMDDADSVGSRAPIAGSPSNSTKGLRSLGVKEWFAVGVLCFVNLINYMDRYTMAGILLDVQKYFNIGDDQGGLLQTVFVISYMVFAPAFGYLGDRYNRKLIMASGIFLWSLTTLLGSFMTSFGWFITFRALVGIGEASYSTIAPTIISDMFIKEVRSKILAMFYFAIPVGSGLGYIVGSEMANLGGSWNWALRVTPALGMLAVVLVLLIREPPRGHSEGSMDMTPTSYKEDLSSLIRNRSFMLCTGGFTCVAFVTGALAWWGPTFIHLGITLQPGNENVPFNDIITVQPAASPEYFYKIASAVMLCFVMHNFRSPCVFFMYNYRVAFVFGVLTMLSGIIGVPLGSYLSQMLIKRYPQADALLCAMGLFVSTPLVLTGMLLVPTSATWAYVFMFFGELALNLNWAIVADILLYVVIPTRRSTAEAFQILFSHAFGDAGSPYLIGVISESLKSFLAPAAMAVTSGVIGALGSTEPTRIIQSIDATEKWIKFRSLQYALFTTCFVEILGGVFFLFTAMYIVRDRTKAEHAVAECARVEPRHIYAEDGVTTGLVE